MIPVPVLLRSQVVNGYSAHLPAYEGLPPEFKHAYTGAYHTNLYVKFVAEWFSYGKTANQIAALKEREGVHRNDALDALVAIWHSEDGKNQLSIFGIAYLLSEWFEF